MLFYVLSDDVGMLCSSSFAIIMFRKRFFLSFTSGFDSGRQFAEGGRGRNRGKLKENLHYLLLGLYLM
jgi:hypothetical protein